MRARSFCAVLAFAVASQTTDILAQTPPSPQTPPTAAASSSADDALRQTAMALLFARVIGVTGIEKAPTGAVKQLSLDVAERSTHLLSELATAVKSSGAPVQLPTSLDASLRDKAELLQSSFESQFEHEYLDMQIAAHRQAVAALGAGGVSTQPAAVSAVTKRIAAEMSKNLAALETIKRQLPAM